MATTITGGQGEDVSLSLGNVNVDLGGGLEGESFVAISQFLQSSGSSLVADTDGNSNANTYSGVDAEGSEKILIVPKGTLTGDMVADLCKDGSVVVQMDVTSVNVTATSKSNVSASDAFGVVDQGLSQETQDIIKAAIASIPPEMKFTVTNVSFAAEKGSTDAVLNLVGKAADGTSVAISANVSGLKAGQTVIIENAPVVMLSEGSNGSSGAQGKLNQFSAASDTTPGAAVKLGNSASTIFGTSKSDLIYSGKGDGSVLNGGGGSDYLYGGQGGKTQIDGGTGNDWLLAGGVDGKGGNTITGGAGNDVLVMGGTITQGTKDFLQNNTAITSDINSKTFLEGLRQFTNGKAGDGNAAAQGDTAVFKDGSGADHLFNFHAGKDMLAIQKGVNKSDITDFDTLKTHMSQVGNDVQVNLGAGNSVVIHDVKLADLSADSFKFI